MYNDQKREYCSFSLIDKIIPSFYRQNNFINIYTFGHTDMCVSENLCLFPAMNRGDGDYTMVTLTDEYLRSEGRKLMALITFPSERRSEPMKIELIDKRTCLSRCRYTKRTYLFEIGMYSHMCMHAQN